MKQDIMGPKSGDDDAQLFMAFAGGDNRAFDRLYRKYRLTLFRSLCRMVGNPAIAEELYQETWITAINAADRYEPTAKFKTWLATIARSRTMDYFRKIGRTIVTTSIDDDDAAIEVPGNTPNPEEIALSAEMVKRFEAGLKLLPYAQCEVFVLKESNDFTWDEIAEIVGSPAETARTRYRAALTKLRSAMGELCPN